MGGMVQLRGVSEVIMMQPKERDRDKVAAEEASSSSSPTQQMDPLEEEEGEHPLILCEEVEGGGARTVYVGVVSADGLQVPMGSMVECIVWLNDLEVGSMVTRATASSAYSALSAADFDSCRHLCSAVVPVRIPPGLNLAACSLQLELLHKTNNDNSNDDNGGGGGAGGGGVGSSSLLGCVEWTGAGLTKLLFSSDDLRDHRSSITRWSQLSDMQQTDTAGWIQVGPPLFLSLCLCLIDDDVMNVTPSPDRYIPAPPATKLLLTASIGSALSHQILVDS